MVKMLTLINVINTDICLLLQDVSICVSRKPLDHTLCSGRKIWDRLGKGFSLLVGYTQESKRKDSTVSSKMISNPNSLNSNIKISKKFHSL